MFPVEISWKGKQSTCTYALLDFSANACFMDHSFAKKHGVPLKSLGKPAPVEVVDGRTISFGDVTQETIPVYVKLGECTNKIAFNIIHSHASLIIRGLPWFESQNPDID